MATYHDYHVAYNAAVRDANEYQRPIGLEKAKEYSTTVFRTFLLPKDPAKRFGHEVTCEVVNPGDPRTETMK